ncbi:MULTISPECIES: hypothetical protein [Caproicibacterium]|uniref:Uncharacterized protein n=1 Tax=Caproicibacterium argilliputei TaxID=3030016 RepID=A0AA97H1F1_9FIRM|nr:hypothetical protein [Caproicibacterium argilliputei]WOC31247.1 hypothetical protein PXC00_08410 [Caproicibacterium argilliputei]
MEIPQQSYRDLFTLMREEPEAKNFYAQLPPETQEEMRSHAFRVNSLDHMRACADAFVRREEQD